MDLTTRIRERGDGFVLFAVTPPRQTTPIDRLAEIATATKDRLRDLGLDGLILYDIDDESSRNPAERPFPFSPTVDPAQYRDEHLQDEQDDLVVH